MWRFFLRQNDNSLKFILKIKLFFCANVPLICEIISNQIFSTLNE